MSLQSILSGILASYLVVTPCLALNHDESNTVDQTNSIEQHTHNHSSGHEHSSHHNPETESETESETEEHCCEDLSTSTHAPLKQLSTPVALVGVLPVVEIYIPSTHSYQRLARSRDGPLYERAKEHAKTIEILA